MSEDLLKHSIDVLKKLKIELHNKVDTSIIVEIDEVIFEIETCLVNDYRDDKMTEKVLSVIGKTIKYLPQIAKLISMIDK